jgi:hypothetical protein
VKVSGYKQHRPFHISGTNSFEKSPPENKHNMVRDPFGGARLSICPSLSDFEQIRDLEEVGLNKTGRSIFGKMLCF